MHPYRPELTTWQSAVVRPWAAALILFGSLIEVVGVLGATASVVFGIWGAIVNLDGGSHVLAAMYWPIVGVVAGAAVLATTYGLGMIALAEGDELYRRTTPPSGY